MRFDEARALLSHLPDRMPAPPAELMPVALATRRKENKPAAALPQ